MILLKAASRTCGLSLHTLSRTKVRPTARLNKSSRNVTQRTADNLGFEFVVGFGDRKLGKLTNDIGGGIKQNAFVGFA